MIGDKGEFMAKFRCSRMSEEVAQHENGLCQLYCPAVMVKRWGSKYCDTPSRMVVVGDGAR